MDINHSCMACSIVCEEKGGHFENVLKLYVVIFEHSLYCQ